MEIIHIYTDGACSGNPGPAGVGIFMKYKAYRKEFSKYIGMATNNIAELTAIKVGLSMLTKLNIPIKIYTDSNYAIGVLTKDWKPKKNKELITEIKTLIDKFDSCELVKVSGHSNNEYNNLADSLAKREIK